MTGRSPAHGPASGSASGPASGPGGPGPVYPLVEPSDGGLEAQQAGCLLCSGPGRFSVDPGAMDTFKVSHQLKSERENG